MNPFNAEFGATGQLYAFRFTPNGYADNRTRPAQAGRASTRRVSTALAALPYRLNTKQNSNAWFPSFGQWLAHDMSAGARRTGPWLNISVARCDAAFDPSCSGTATIAFVRQGGPIDGDGVQRAINANTAWIDLSPVYGHEADTAAALRTGRGGHLRTTPGDGGDRPDPLLAYQPGVGFVSGDAAVNSNPQLTLIETLFTLEHNRLADQLSRQNPLWSDEDLYQEARRLLIAINQKITYKEYLPRLLGHHIADYGGFRLDLDPSIDVSFIAGAFRYGHSAMNSRLPLLGEDRRPVRDGFLSMTDLAGTQREFLQYGLGALLRGLMTLPEAKVDLHIIAELRQIENPRLPGVPMDLVAEDLQRGRDLGAASYNSARRALGLAPARTFADLNPDPAVQAVLQGLYATVDDVDLLVGGLAEDDPERILGSTFDRLVTAQFTVLRDADPLYYERPGLFTDAERALIDARTLSQIIVDNTNVEWMPADAFALQTVAAGEAMADSVTSAREVLRPLAGLEMRWLIDGDVLDVELISRLGGWVGVGFGKQMAGADVILGYVDLVHGPTVVDAQVANEYDYVAVPKADVSRGCRDDLLPGAVATRSVDGSLRVRFRRHLQTGDPCDRPVDRGLTAMIFAHGPSDTPQQHGNLNRAQVQVDLFAAYDRQFMDEASAITLLTVAALLSVVHLLSLSGLIWYRKKRYMMKSGVGLLILANVGFLLLDVFVFLTCVPQSVPICVSRAAFFAIGLTLVSVPTTIKLFRFYRIFGSSMPSVFVIRNLFLVMFTGTVLLIDAVLIGVVAFVSPIGPTLEHPNQCVAETGAQAVVAVLVGLKLALLVLCRAFHHRLSAVSGKTLNEFRSDINAEGYLAVSLLVLVAALSLAVTVLSLSDTLPSSRTALHLSGSMGVIIAGVPFAVYVRMKALAYLTRRQAENDKALTRLDCSRTSPQAAATELTRAPTAERMLSATESADTGKAAAPSAADILRAFDQAHIEYTVQAKTIERATERMADLRLQMLRLHEALAVAGGGAAPSPMGSRAHRMTTQRQDSTQISDRQ